MSKVTTKKAILAAFKPGEHLLSGDVLQRVDMSIAYVNRILAALVCEGMLARTRTERTGVHGGHLEFTYCLKTDEAVSTRAETVGAPYRDLRLTENLVDYDRTPHSFQALCMMARK